MVLQFTGAFNLETNSVCSWDYLTMTDGDGTTLMGKTCGTSLPNNITSVTNVIEMVFRTDGGTTGEGWSLSWRALLPGVSFPYNQACSLHKRFEILILLDHLVGSHGNNN